MNEATDFLKEDYDILVKSNLNWRLWKLEGASTPISKVEGKEVIMLCSNNYLGLTNHPLMKEAAIESIKSHGVGSGSVRAIAGNMDLHEDLEDRLAKFKGVEASLTYVSGFAVNAGLIPQLVPKESDVIVSDELNHGSIIDGVRLSKAKRFVYKHNDMSDLERVMKEVEKSNPRRILIITDGVFSMDGDVALLDEIQRITEPYNSLIYVDDAHGEGVLGDGGRGIVNHFRLEGKIHIEMGTFSKAFGVIGGHINGSRDLVNFALNKSRTWLLSGSQPPAVVAACIAGIDILETEPKHVENLWENTNYFKKELSSLGFDTGISTTPITPVIVGESEKAKKLSEGLLEEGVFALPIVFPMVAKDKARIRTIMNAALTKEHLNKALSSFELVGKKLKII
ncbi:MAG: aminotransferase class I/II-fold pyridoxal phosphate-dependent enzyme [Candidatus Ranarchaeia archaeon]